MGLEHHCGVPFHPPPGRAVADPRLDPYRSRAGNLCKGGELIGVVYLVVESFWLQVGGQLWWRSWSQPREQIHGYLLFEDGGFDDFVEDAHAVIDELADWRHGYFRYRGDVLEVRWLSHEESDRVRMDTFGLPHQP